MTDPIPSDPLKPYRKFRITAVRMALFVTAGMAAAAYVLFNAVTAQGVLLGGIAGTLGFWLMAVRLEKLANMAPGKVHFAALTGTFLRFLLYGVTLYRAFTLDREEMHGLLGAVAGIFVIRFVTVFMGVTGLHMPTNDSAKATDPTNEAQDVEEHRE